MQTALFGIEFKNVNTKKVEIRTPKNGAKDAISRYSGIKALLDNDKLTNGNWKEIETIKVSDKPSEYTFIDLFSGAGGISVGVKQAGFKKLASVEIDKDASATIRNNFPESVHFELPIENLSEAMLAEKLGNPKVNVIFGGPPCQGFSVAGLRDPEDPRNKLFQEYVRIVKYFKPEFIVLENVPGILTMEKGRVYKEILKQFEEIGYPNMSVRILEAASFGVPQLRTRAIFIANRLGIENLYPKAIFDRRNYNTIESAIDDLKCIPRNAKINHEWT